MKHIIEYNENFNLEKVKSKYYFTDEEKEILSEYGFNVHKNVSVSEYENKILITIKKEFRYYIQFSYNGKTIYQHSFYKDLNIEEVIESIVDVIETWYDKIKNYEKELKKYNELSGFKKRFTPKPILD